MNIYSTAQFLIIGDNFVQRSSARVELVFASLQDTLDETGTFGYC